jgi:uncharacterized protein YraI
MTRSVVGGNIEVALLQNKAPVKQLYKDMQSAAHTFVVHSPNDLSVIHDWRRELAPDYAVARVYLKDRNEGQMHMPPLSPADVAANKRWIVSPEDFLNVFGEFGRNGLILNVHNEPAPPNNDGERWQEDRLIEWALKYLDLIAPLATTPKKTASVLFNFGFHQPSKGRWKFYHEALRRANELPDVYIGLHLYVHPTLPYEDGDTLKELDEYCRANGFNNIKVIVTEWGFDKGGGKGDGYQSPLYGFKDSRDAVRRLYTSFQAYLKPYVASGRVVGVCYFGHGHADFPGMDPSGDPDFLDQMTFTAKNGGFAALLPMPPKPPETKPGTAPLPYPSPAPLGEPMGVISKAARTLRNGPSTSYRVLEEIPVSTEVNLYTQQVITDSSKQAWVWCDYVTDKGQRAGWVCISGWSYRYKPVDKPSGTPVRRSLTFAGVRRSVRQGPGEKWDAAGSLVKGTPVDVWLKPVQGWMYVENGLVKGWVDVDGISFNMVADNTPDTIVLPAPSKGCVYVQVPAALLDTLAQWVGSIERYPAG